MKHLKTLDQAREAIAGLQSENATLSARVNELMSDELCSTLGLEKIEVDGKLSFKNARAEQLSDELETAKAAFASNAETFEKLSGELSEKASELETAQAAIKILESERLSVSSQAREMLAAQGAAPLAVDGSDSVAELTIAELQQALATETNSLMRFALYKKLKDKRRNK